MPKKVSEIQKKEIIESFVSGETIDKLSEKFNCTKITITRHLKKNISENVYKKLIKEKIKKNKIESNITNSKRSKPLAEKRIENQRYEQEKNFSESPFLEIPPLNFENINLSQKDLASVPILDANLPNVVYLIVDKEIELETKLLKDYSDWKFLSEIELNRKTIEIHFDLKNAKRLCNKDHRVIKVPNANVFKIVAPLLRSRGITRIVSDNNLIAL